MSRTDAPPPSDPPPTHSSPRAVAAADHPHHSGLARAVHAVFSVTLLSRLGGLARDVIVARVFGDTPLNSAFQIAFAIPNMFRRLFGEGALSAAFIPEYAARANDRPPEAGALASLTIAALGLVTGLATVALELALLALLLLLPPSPERQLSLTLIMVMLPFMPMICIVAILAGMLQVHGRFAASSTGPLLLNAFIILTGLWAIATGHGQQHGGERVAYLFAIATTLSGLTQAIWFTRLLRPHVRWTRAWDAARPAARAMLTRFGPVLIGLGALQFSALLDHLITMWPIWVGPTILGHAYPLDGRSAGILAAAQRLYQFPLGVFGIAVATAVFPMLSRHAANPADPASLDAFTHTLRRGLRLSLLLGLPASAGLLLVRDDLTRVLYAGAAVATASDTPAAGFSAEGLSRAAAVLAGYAPAVWAFALNHVLIRAFYAKGDTRSPMRVALALVAFNFALNLVLIWPLREAGLAWSSAVSGFLQTAVLLALLRRRFPGHAPIDRDTLLGAARLVLASLIMAAACLTLRALWPIATAPGADAAIPGGEWGAWSAHAFRLAATCALGLVSFALAAVALRAPEVRWLVRTRDDPPR